jgi:NADH:ubiquinone oxidoreductase subunit D
METPTVHHGAMFDTNELVINMGPQHPSTHGVLRVILRLDGEKVVDVDVVIGYLHRGIEKLSENRNWTQQCRLLRDGREADVDRGAAPRALRADNPL